MFKNSRFYALLLILVFIISCNSAPKAQEVKEVKKVADTTATIPYDKPTDDLVSFISGMENGKSGCIPKLEPVVKWLHYANELDSLFTHINYNRFQKMKVWADSELVNNNKTTVFYPFSGPDILNANIFYPNADQYIMIAQEPIGALPDICKMNPDSVRSYLNSVNYSLRDIFLRSYFITSRMNTDLQKTKVNGTLPLMTLFIKRTGHNIVSIHKIGIDSTGRFHDIDSAKSFKKFVTGVKIEFVAPATNKIQTAYYFRADLSDKGLNKNAGFRKYLAGLPQSYTYLKAASYLMHGDEFKEIRTIVFDKSSTILQDDSGIAYKFFDKKEWDIKLYGVYSKPGKEFSYISEPDLEKAFKSPSVKPLPYVLGYNWAKGNCNMLYAVKKAK